MLKNFKKVALFAILFVCMFALTSCGGVTEKYATKINEAAKAGEHLSYADVEKKCGDPTFDLRVGGSGVVTWVKGISADDYKKMVEDAKNGVDNPYKKMEGKDSITVTFLGGKAQSAVFSAYKAEK